MTTQNTEFPRAWTDVSEGQYRELDAVFHRLNTQHGDTLDRDSIIQLCFEQVDTDY